MRSGFGSLATLKDVLTAQSPCIYRPAPWLFAVLRNSPLTIGSKHVATACCARPGPKTYTHPQSGSRCSDLTWRETNPHFRLSSKTASVRPSQGKLGDAPSRAARAKRPNKRRRRSKGKSKHNAKTSADLSYSTYGSPSQPSHGVIDFLLRGTSIPSPGATSTASLRGNDGLPPVWRSRLVRGRPGAPSISSSPKQPSTHDIPMPAPKGRVPRTAARPGTPASALKPTTPRQCHTTYPVTQLLPPRHCALWRVLQRVPVPVQDAAARAFSLLGLVMPLPGHYARPQPALTAHNARLLLSDTPGASWPIELGSLTAAAAQQAHGFPHTEPCMRTAEDAFERSWNLDKLAGERQLPQTLSGQLLSAIRASLPAVVHASYSNAVALKVSALALMCGLASMPGCGRSASGRPSGRVPLASSRGGCL